MVAENEVRQYLKLPPYFPVLKLNSAPAGENEDENETLVGVLEDGRKFRFKFANSKKKLVYWECGVTGPLINKSVST